MDTLQPGDDVLILDDPRCPRLAGLHATYQGANDEGHALIQVGDVGAVEMTVPPACLRLAEQRTCKDCGNPFWRVVGTAMVRCGFCQARVEEEEDFDPAALVTDEDIEDWSNPEYESGLAWDAGAGDAPPRRKGGGW